MKTKKILFNLLRNCQGFSLAEVLVALSILSAGLLGVAGMQIMSVSGNSFGREMQLAILAGQDLVENINSLNSTAEDLKKGDHTLKNNDFHDTLPHIVTPDPTIPGFRFIRDWNVVNDVPFPGSQEITITISWNNRSGDHSLDMHTTRLK